MIPMGLTSFRLRERRAAAAAGAPKPPPPVSDTDRIAALRAENVRLRQLCAEQAQRLAEPVPPEAAEPSDNDLLKAELGRAFPRPFQQAKQQQQKRRV